MSQLPSCPTTKVASAAAWQTSISTCWWRTAWTAATAGWYRSFPVNCGASGGERKRSAPRTAARAEQRHETRTCEFSRRWTRKWTSPNRQPVTWTRFPVYRQRTRGCSAEANRSARMLHQMMQVPLTRRQILLLTGTKAQIFRICGGRGRPDGR